MSGDRHGHSFTDDSGSRTKDSGSSASTYVPLPSVSQLKGIEVV